MPDYTQFGSVESNFRLSANFSPPFEVGEEQTAEEATKEWVESLTDEELGEYLRENAIIEPW